MFEPARACTHLRAHTHTQWGVGRKGGACVFPSENARILGMLYVLHCGSFLRASFCLVKRRQFCHLCLESTWLTKSQYTRTSAALHLQSSLYSTYICSCPPPLVFAYGTILGSGLDSPPRSPSFWGAEIGRMCVSGNGGGFVRRTVKRRESYVFLVFFGFNFFV